jgi:hypothetical protein
MISMDPLYVGLLIWAAMIAGTAWAIIGKQGN